MLVEYSTGRNDMNSSKNSTSGEAVTLKKYVGTELLNNPDLFLVISNYGALRKNWFGKSDSVEAVTNELKSHEEWSGDDNEPTVFHSRESKHNGESGCFINTLK